MWIQGVDDLLNKHRLRHSWDLRWLEILFVLEFVCLINFVQHLVVINVFSHFLFTLEQSLLRHERVHADLTHEHLVVMLLHVGFRPLQTCILVAISLPLPLLVFNAVVLDGL